MPKIIEIPKLTPSQCEADQKLNEIQKLLDDGKDQKTIHFLIDAITWLINDRVDQLKGVLSAPCKEWD